MAVPGRHIPGQVARLHAARGPVEPKTHAAWIGAGGGAALGGIVVGLIQVWVTHRALSAASVSLVDTICAAVAALVSSYLAPHQARPEPPQSRPPTGGGGGGSSTSFGPFITAGGGSGGGTVVTGGGSGGM